MYKNVKVLFNSVWVAIWIARALSRTAVIIVFALAFVLVAEAQESPAKQTDELKKVRVNGVQLQYIERGSGPTVVFVHGGLDDYRYWKDEMQPFSLHYRVISYSRRYNYPNNNLTIGPNYSASVDADDLAALITSLKLGRVHLVGASYGAYAALILAKKHPEMVRTLVLAEAPVLRLARSTPNGAALYDEFMTTFWGPLGAALRSHEDDQALKLTIEHFLGPGTYDQVPKDLLQGLRANLREWRELTVSSDVFPDLSRTDLKKIKTPVLMLNGEHTDAIDRFVDGELWPLLRAEHVLIPNATHDMWSEQPAACEQATLAFLAKN